MEKLVLKNRVLQNLQENLKRVTNNEWEIPGELELDKNIIIKNIYNKDNWRKLSIEFSYEVCSNSKFIILIEKEKIDNFVGNFKNEFTWKMYFDLNGKLLFAGN